MDRRVGSIEVGCLLRLDGSVACEGGYVTCRRRFGVSMDGLEGGAGRGWVHWARAFQLHTCHFTGRIRSIVVVCIAVAMMVPIRLVAHRSHKMHCADLHTWWGGGNGSCAVYSGFCCVHN